MGSDRRVRLLSWACRVGVAALLGAGWCLAMGGPASADWVRDAQWEHRFLDIAKVHQVTRGEGVTVAVVDTGVDGRHPDLAGTVLEGYDQTDMAFGNGWKDQRGHGTAMASVIAAHGHGPSRRDGALGIAPGVKILPCKQGDGIDGNPDYTAGAIRKAVELGADVINVSLGYPAQASPALREAVTRAIQSDVVVVVGAGNTSSLLKHVTAPGNYAGVVTVSAIGRDGRFSSASLSGPEVVLAAPGVDIIHADPTQKSGYSVGTGTSNSAAIVSGVAALIRAKYPDLNAPSVIQRLTATADDKGPKGRDNQYGFGIVNPHKALTADIAPVKHNPLLPDPGPSKTTSPPESGGSGSYLLAGLAALVIISMVVIAGWLTVRTIRRRRP